MSGYEATLLIKEINPDLPVIAQTAYAMHNDREKCLENGCDDYISKPISKDLLYRKIFNLL
jgi:CheY-like chemotaxis protein